MAIAKRDAPARHWFRLGRAVTAVANGAALISWSGSMFEYLMPSIVMRAPAESLIEQTNRLIVHRQIEYGTTIRAPWGVSESAYNAQDLEFTYQYSNFGIPGLGLKRGLADNAVVAPYATALASMVDPQAAVQNFERLEALGGRGRFGFYEALDFTRARVPDGERVAIVRAFMAHHQGMTITAIADALLDGLMRNRFHAEPIVQATGCSCRSACHARSRLPCGGLGCDVGGKYPRDRRARHLAKGRVRTPLRRPRSCCRTVLLVMLTAAGPATAHGATWP